MIENDLRGKLDQQRDMKGQKFDMEFTSKQRRFVQDADMLTNDPTINVGPG